jgi:L-asparaginase
MHVARAIVVAGFGPGDVTPAELDAMRRANTAGVVIVQASRTLGGQVLTRSDLKDESFMAAARTPQKARILAMVALASGAEKGDLQTLFESAT